MVGDMGAALAAGGFEDAGVPTSVRGGPRASGRDIGGDHQPGGRPSEPAALSARPGRRPVDDPHASARRRPRLKALGPTGRAAEACIGPDRADLVLAGRRDPGSRPARLAQRAGAGRRPGPARRAAAAADARGPQKPYAAAARPTRRSVSRREPPRRRPEPARSMSQIEKSAPRAVAHALARAWKAAEAGVQDLDHRAFGLGQVGGDADADHTIRIGGRPRRCRRRRP